MSNTSKLKPTLITVVAVLALGLVAYTFLQTPERPADGPAMAQTAQTGAPAEAGALIDEVIEAPEMEGDLSDSSPEGQRSRPLGRVEASRLRERVVDQETFPHDMAMSEYKALLWEEIQANPPRLERPGDPAVDAELAYTLYMFYGNCSMAPRTEMQVDFHLKRLADQAQQSKSRRLDSLERRADQMIEFYELCLAIPPEVDCRLEAFVWMAEAVRLGHEIAQVQYYEKIKGFLMRSDRYTDDPPLAMKQPGLVEQFKDTARMALNLAMDKGHPEAYLAMSQAVYEGLIYPKDPVLALAYARMAEMKGTQNRVILRGLERRKHSIAQFLNPDQVADAEELALQMWRESSS